MTAGGLLDMYLISCVSACVLLVLLLYLFSIYLLGKYVYIEIILLKARPDGPPLPLHDHQRPWSITLGNRTRHQQQQ
jgi:hypothetical protein